LKSDDPDLKPDAGSRSDEVARFTRERIVKALEGIGPAVKDALPEFEVALGRVDIPLSRKSEEKEDT